jgi:hypothetical protein
MILSRIVRSELMVFGASAVLWLGCFLAALLSKGGAAVLGVPFTLVGAILVGGAVYFFSRSIKLTAIAFLGLFLTSLILVMIGGTFAFAAKVFSLPFTSLIGFLVAAVLGVVLTLTSPPSGAGTKLTT